MNEHICEICFLPVSQHPERCPAGHNHMPPNCCVGCSCGQWCVATTEAS